MTPQFELWMIMMRIDIFAIVGKGLPTYVNFSREPITTEGATK